MGDLKTGGVIVGGENSYEWFYKNLEDFQEIVKQTDLLKFQSIWKKCGTVIKGGERMNKTHCDLCETVIEDTEKSESVRYRKKENFVIEKLYDIGLIGRIWNRIDICKNCFDKLILEGSGNEKKEVKENSKKIR